MRNDKRVLHGQDIEDSLTSHELARLLLAGPDLMVHVPDEDTVDSEKDFVTSGRLTHDDRGVYLSGYYLGATKISDRFEVSESYQHAK